MKVIKHPWLCGFCLLLLITLFSSGCASSPPDGSVVQVRILHKEVSMGPLGECIYRTEMLVNNTGSANIPSVTIIIELFDPDVQKTAARQSRSLGPMQGGETRNVTSTLQTHCRQNYTLRALAEY